MPVTFQQIDPNTVRLDIEIPAEALEAAFERELRRQRAQMRIRGFRPGKAPLSLIKGYVGDQVLAEVTGELMQESLLQAVEEHAVHAVGTPKLEREAHKPGEPVRFSAIFEVHEKPREIDLAGLKAVRLVIPIEDAAVEEQLERLREIHARTEPLDPPRPAGKGDLARIDYELRFDDRPHDEPIKREGLELEVGAGYVLDEIAAALEGMTVGEEKTVAVAFPADHRVATLAGRAGNARLKLVDLALRRLPTLDDEFAREVGEADLTALRAKVRAELEAEARRLAESDVEHSLLEQVVERAKPSLPTQWLEEQFRDRLAAFQRTFGGGRELGVEEQTTLRQEIERQIRRTVVIGWLARQKGLQATAEQVEKRMQQIAESLGKPLPAVKADFARKGTGMLEIELTEENVLAVLKAEAAIEERTTDAPAKQPKRKGAEKVEKAEKTAKAEKPEKPEQPVKPEKAAKPSKSEKPPGPEKSARSEKPPRKP
ncbi:MAG: trigger factor [Deltaproteobacteria bacterium]|nr:trigger factor [Deltaproteobacteria bacterium]